MVSKWRRNNEKRFWRNGSFESFFNVIFLILETKNWEYGKITSLKHRIDVICYRESDMTVKNGAIILVEFLGINFKKKNHVIVKPIRFSVLSKNKKKKQKSNMIIINYDYYIRFFKRNSSSTHWNLKTSRVY